jgi:predicted nucleic-acid-binding Zn-ribbon protein
MREHPEWLAVDADGNFIDTQGVPKPHFYNTICLNSGYREFFKEHLQDVRAVLQPIQY